MSRPRLGTTSNRDVGELRHDRVRQGLGPSLDERDDEIDRCRDPCDPVGERRPQVRVEDMDDHKDASGAPRTNGADIRLGQQRLAGEPVAGPGQQGVAGGLRISDGEGRGRRKSGRCGDVRPGHGGLAPLLPGAVPQGLLDPTKWGSHPQVLGELRLRSLRRCHLLVEHQVLRPQPFVLLAQRADQRVLVGHPKAIAHQPIRSVHRVRVSRSPSDWPDLATSVYSLPGTPPSAAPAGRRGWRRDWRDTSSLHPRWHRVPSTLPLHHVSRPAGSPIRPHLRPSTAATAPQGRRSWKKAQRDNQDRPPPARTTSARS